MYFFAFFLRPQAIWGACRAPELIREIERTENARGASNIWGASWACQQGHGDTRRRHSKSGRAWRVLSIFARCWCNAHKNSRLQAGIFLGELSALWAVARLYWFRNSSIRLTRAKAMRDCLSRLSRYRLHHPIMTLPLVKIITTRFVDSLCCLPERFCSQALPRISTWSANNRAQTFQITEQTEEKRSFVLFVEAQTEMLSHKSFMSLPTPSSFFFLLCRRSALRSEKKLLAHCSYFSIES